MMPVWRNPYLLAALSGVLCILSFPPYNLSFLIWFALVPLIYAILNSSFSMRRRGFFVYRPAPLTGAIFGIVFYYGTLHWIYTIFHLFGLVLVLVLCIYTYVFAYLLSYTYNKFKKSWTILLLPSVFWVSVEFIKSEAWWLKFSWMNLGYTQHNALPILQFSSILGQYGLTALIVFVNSFIVYLYFNRKNIKQSLIVGGAVIVLLISIMSYGFYGLSQKYSPNVNVALIQDESSEFQNYKTLINSLSKDVNFILLPEYAVPTFLADDSELLQEIKNITNIHSAYMIVGSEDGHLGSGKWGYYNTAYIFSPAGEIIGKYNKMNPIQFFKDGDPGKEYSVFSTNHGKIGVFICYDMDYSYVARNIVRNGAEILFIPTYDAMRWTELQHLQHSAMTSMRAVENGRFIARATTSGISQIIDPKGRITTTIPIGVSGTAIGSVSSVQQKTFYTNYGYIFPYLMIVLALAVLIYGMFRGFRTSD